MKKYRVCKNENNKYKIQGQVKILKFFYFWSDYGKQTRGIMWPPLHVTTIYNTKKEALLALEEIKDDETLEAKSSTWQCTELF